MGYVLGRVVCFFPIGASHSHASGLPRLAASGHLRRCCQHRRATLHIPTLRAMPSSRSPLPRCPSLPAMRPAATSTAGCVYPTPPASPDRAGKPRRTPSHRPRHACTTLARLGNPSPPCWLIVVVAPCLGSFSSRPCKLTGWIRHVGLSDSRWQGRVSCHLPSRVVRT